MAENSYHLKSRRQIWIDKVKA